MAASATGPESQRQSAMIRAALSYAARGVPVFPCEPSGKRPLTPNGFWEATTDERRIRAWWRRWPEANIGVPTGRGSGLLVLDVDAGDGLEALAELELLRGQPPKTARARTGGGGKHVYFRYSKDVEVRNSQGYLGPGLDIRAEGGYVVVPPSRTTGPYEWVERSRPADASWLLGCLEERMRQEAGETLF
jgi:Bifunctional DNA primase/polymerase, N-terminal